MFRKLAAATAMVFLFAAFPLGGASAMSPDGEADYRLADLSHHDTVSDWSAVAANVNGVYLKATEGVTYTDVAYAENTHQAKLQGIPVGYYHFFWPWSGDIGPFKARQQADHFYNTTKANSQQLLPVVDVEEVNGCTPEEITSAVGAFCDELVRVDGAPGVMIYCSPKFADAYLSGLTNYPLWVANYNVSEPLRADGWQTWSAWQYTSSGSLPGVLRGVDLSRATAGVYLITPPSVKPVAPVTPPDKPALIAEDIFSVIRLPYPINAKALADLDVRDRNGLPAPGRQIYAGDKIVVTGLLNQGGKILYDVIYPTSKGYVHGFATGKESLYSFSYTWRNGRTDEPVYDAFGARIGTIFPYETAKRLYLSPYTGQPFLLYDTSAGPGTKVGFVNFMGLR